MVIKTEDRELIKKGYRALIRELGLVGFVRFVRLTEGGRGNWTEERKEVLKEYNEMDIKELGELIKRNVRNQKKGQIVI